MQLASAETCQPEENPIILPANSVVFSMRQNYGAYHPQTPELAAAVQSAGVSSYQQMMVNPVELMMLSQLDMPLGEKSTKFF
ncbi:MAG: hypothetical protein LRZ85_03500 [Alphaproteobacteria bacterium]|nr:hypothetical protein [Alphaproteobacteria bacterium]